MAGPLSRDCSRDLSQAVPEAITVLKRLSNGSDVFGCEGCHSYLVTTRDAEPCLTALVDEIRDDPVNGGTAV